MPGLERLNSLDLNTQSSLLSGFKKILKLALPMLCSQILAVFSGFLCMLMLGHVSHGVLAASALIFSLQTTLMIIGTSLLMVLAYMIGHAMGVKKYDWVGVYVQHGFLIAFCTGVLIFILSSFLGPILLALKESPVLVPIVVKFFNIYRFSFFALVSSMVLAQLFYGTQHAPQVFLRSALSCVVLVLVAWVLIHGDLGFPALGVQGFAIGILIQNLVLILTLVLYITRHDSFKKFGIFHLRFFKHWGQLGQMLKSGWPICVQMSGELLAFSAAAVMVGWLGTNPLAAYQIVIQCWFLLVIVVFGLSHSMGILVGQARGENNWNQIRALLKAGFAITLIFVLLIALIFIIFPKFLTNLFIHPGQPNYVGTLILTIPLFAVIALNQFFDGFRNVMIGGLRGLLDTRFPMWLSLILLWLVGMPLSYLFGFVLHGGLIGIAFGSTLGMIIAVILIALRWRMHLRNNK